MHSASTKMVAAVIPNNVLKWRFLSFFRVRALLFPFTISIFLGATESCAVAVPSSGQINIVECQFSNLQFCVRRVVVVVRQILRQMPLRRAHPKRAFKTDTATTALNYFRSRARIEP